MTLRINIESKFCILISGSKIQNYISVFVFWGRMSSLPTDSIIRNTMTSILEFKPVNLP